MRNRSSRRLIPSSRNHWHRKQVDKQKIITIARRVRQWLKRKAKDGVYSIDHVDLSEGCGIASARLLGELLREGVKEARIIQGSWHAYIRIGDHILDITATQFTGFEKHPILFMPWKEFIVLPKTDWWTYGIGKPIACHKRFRQLQIRGDWPEEQIIQERHLI